MEGLIGNTCESSYQYYFPLIEEFRALTQEDHMSKRRTTEARCQGVRDERIPLSLQSAEVLSGKISGRKTCLGDQDYPPSYRYPRCTRLKQPVSWSLNEVAFAIPKKDRYIF